MRSAPQLEEVNVKTSRSRDLEKLINRDIDVLSLRLLERQRNRVIGRGDEASLLDTGKVCLCPTNCHLSHKDPCPNRGGNHSKVVITEQWKSRNRTSLMADVPPAYDGTDGTSGYPTPKTSRRSSSYIKGRGQRRNQTSSELAS